MEHNYQLVNKKNMFLNLLSYYNRISDSAPEKQSKDNERVFNPIENIPFTYYIRIDYERWINTTSELISSEAVNDCDSFSLSKPKQISNLNDLKLKIANFK